jgi:hypothetical protein
MSVLSVVHVGKALEASGDGAGDVLLADVSASPGLGPARGLEDAVVREAGHDRVNVMAVVSVEQALEHVELHVIRSHAATSSAFLSGGKTG